jgi:hypothetical protein
VFKSFPHALLALGEALLRCWPLFFVAAIPALVLALSGQGRDALFIAAGGIGLGEAALVEFAVLLIVIYASLILDVTPSRARPRRAALYARQTAPQLLAVATAFGLPLLVRYATPLEPEYTITVDLAAGSRISVGFFLQSLQVVGPLVALMVPALLVSNSRLPLTQYEAIPLVVIGSIYALTFIFTGEASVLTRFGVLAVTIIVVNWLLPQSYAHANQLIRGRLKAIGWPVFLCAAGLLGYAAYLAAEPATRAPWWGPMGVILLSMVAWMSAGFLVEWGIWWLTQVRGFARNRLALSAIRLAVLVLVAWRLLSGAFNDEPVRIAAAEDPAPPLQTLSGYLDEWLKAREAHATREQPYAVFIVTAEGGGIRAGYWTATMLAALQDRHARFAQHVLALSGVSGGSVGASIFAALVASPGTATSAPCRVAQGLEPCAARIARGDLLSAPLASMLLAEPFSRLTGVFADSDRAAELERALERAWREATGNDRFAEPFSRVAAAERLVLPNATSAATGERIIISPVDTKGFGAAQRLDGRGYALSTATLLSARFPAITPAGVHQASAGDWLRIVDGGYADNSGAATGADVLRALIAALDRTKLQGRFKPVVITISNSEQARESEPLQAGLRALTIGTLVDPVLTLDSVRAATSRRYEAELRERVEAAGGRFFSGLRLPYRDVEIPLGWMLAPRSADVMDARRRELAAHPSGDFQRIGAVLKGE